MNTTLTTSVNFQLRVIHQRRGDNRNRQTLRGWHLWPLVKRKCFPTTSSSHCKQKTECYRSWALIWWRNCLPICFSFCLLWLSDSLMGNQSVLQAPETLPDPSCSAKETSEIHLIHWEKCHFRKALTTQFKRNSLVKNAVFLFGNHQWKRRQRSPDVCFVLYLRDITSGTDGLLDAPTRQSFALENTSDET